MFLIVSQKTQGALDRRRNQNKTFLKDLAKFKRARNVDIRQPAPAIAKIGIRTDSRSLATLIHSIYCEKCADIDACVGVGYGTKVDGSRRPALAEVLHCKGRIHAPVRRPIEGLSNTISLCT